MTGGWVVSRPLGSVWIDGVEFLITEPTPPRPITEENDR